MRRFSKITTTQLARICGVSQGTVDRALHGREGISEETREKILAAAKEYDYLPSVAPPKGSNSMLIGVVLFDLYNEFFSKLAMSLVNAAQKVGYSIIFQFSGKDEKDEKAALAYFDYIGVDGIILFSVGSDSEEYANYLRSLKKPLVLVGNKMFDLPNVWIDDRRAMRDMTLKLAEDTDGDLIYFAPILKRELSSGNAQRRRFEGFVEAATSLGKNHRIVTDVENIKDFGGIVCASDYYALRVLKHLNFPDNVKISGFDNISMLKYINTPVNTVEYSTDRIAEECLNYILGKRFATEIEHKLIDCTDPQAGLDRRK